MTSIFVDPLVDHHYHCYASYGSLVSPRMLEPTIQYDEDEPESTIPRTWVDRRFLDQKIILFFIL